MSDSIETIGNSFNMTPNFAPSHSSVTTADGSSISADNEAAIARWRFNRARTEKEHAAFRERMQFQSADFHQFLAETARTSPKVAVPSPAWESIPFPVPVSTSTIIEESDDQHSEMNVSLDETQEVPRRQATPMDFSLGNQQNQAALDIPAFSFDFPSFDDNLGSIELQSFPESELHTNAQPSAGNQQTMITVGAVFELPRNPSDVRYPFSRASNMATAQDLTHSDHNRSVTHVDALGEYDDGFYNQAGVGARDEKEERNCLLLPFGWIKRQLGNLRHLL
ncbi:uncharacterized protein EAF01_004665 [Botrytis porri]|uniref:uncharacterized protein n=1 Tax=Botrytis porri TaxID=87229 RepID=UPI001901AC03|nr:uncharacterized protein EAF01_004665 [Botrytis porri]KAF7907078.1 hypothetical protein EAF01_004665 [Botrytis porri]